MKKNIKRMIKKEIGFGILTDYVIDILEEILEDQKEIINIQEVRNELLTYEINDYLISYFDYDYNSILNDCHINQIDLTDNNYQYIDRLNNDKVTTIDEILNVLLYNVITDMIQDLNNILEDILEEYYK